MKIFMVSASRVPSLTANSMQVMKAAQATAQCGHDVTLILPGQEAVDFDRLADHYGLQTRFAIQRSASRRAWRGYDLAWKAVKEARRQKADLLYTWMPQAAELALWQKLPVVLEMHDLPSGRLGPSVFRQFWKLPGRKRMTCITRALLERLVVKYDLHPAQGEAVVNPNGVDLERYQDLPEPEQARADLGLPQVFTAGYSGHFYPGRGMDLMLSLARANPQAQFMWMGGRPEAVEEWRLRLSAERIANVTLTGFINNRVLPRWQSAADVLLMPYERRIAGSSGGDSAAIASPMKMFEYMACGRAIITSDLPVIREVQNEGNAVFCPPDDPGAWQEALARLQADTDLRQRLAGQARLDAAGYTWEKRQERILEGI